MQTGATGQDEEGIQRLRLRRRSNRRGFYLLVDFQFFAGIEELHYTSYKGLFTLSVLKCKSVASNKCWWSLDFIGTIHLLYRFQQVLTKVSHDWQYSHVSIAFNKCW